jgi:hypothetical protein
VAVFSNILFIYSWKFLLPHLVAVSHIFLYYSRHAALRAYFFRAVKGLAKIWLPRKSWRQAPAIYTAKTI